MKNFAFLLLFPIALFLGTAISGQNIIINLPPNPPANTANWASGGNVFSITITGTAALAESRMLVFIRSTSGQLVCGSNQPATAQPANISPGQPKAWVGQNAVGLLGNGCLLPTGSYELCVQILPFRGQGKEYEQLTKCMPFDIREVECTAPNNILPAASQVLTYTDILKPVSFSWSPLVMQGKGLVTYRLMVWEVEEGQTMYEAMYNNYPLINKDIKATTRYIVPPGIFEKRNAQYVWRVFAIGDDGRPVCKNAQSEPTVFSVNIPDVVVTPPTKDSTQPQSPDSCCANKVVVKSQTVKVSPANVASIEQNFNITPFNIVHVSAEIVSVKESVSDTSCMKCSPNDNWIYSFISQNTAAWNSGTAYNASPVNASTYYPSKMIDWYCNKQGDIQFKFKIALPQNNSGCNRKSTICIRYKFTDSNCINCEQIICYDINN